MKIETKGIFEALPNCMSLQDIIDYLDSKNYDERKAKEEYHEMYEEGSIILNNRIKVSCESKNRVQIEYTEFERRSIVKDDYIVHQPSWLIVPTTNSNDVWVRGSVVCYFTKREEQSSDPFVGQFKCNHSVKRTYSGVVHSPYTELTAQKLELMLKDSIRNLKYIIDEVRYDDVEVDKLSIQIPIILND